MTRAFKSSLALIGLAASTVSAMDITGATCDFATDLQKEKQPSEDPYMLVVTVTGATPGGNVGLIGSESPDFGASETGDVHCAEWNGHMEVYPYDADANFEGEMDFKQADETGKAVFRYPVDSCDDPSTLFALMANDAELGQCVGSQVTQMGSFMGTHAVFELPQYPTKNTVDEVKEAFAYATVKNLINLGEEDSRGGDEINIEVEPYFYNAAQFTYKDVGYTYVDNEAADSIFVSVFIPAASLAESRVFQREIRKVFANNDKQSDARLFTAQLEELGLKLGGQDEGGTLPVILRDVDHWRDEF